MANNDAIQAAAGSNVGHIGHVNTNWFAGAKTETVDNKDEWKKHSIFNASQYGAFMT